MKCRRCNSELPDDATFCPNCGATFIAKKKKARKPKKQLNESEMKVENKDGEIETEIEKVSYEQDTSIPALVFLAVASFLIPVLGLILFLAWINCKPKASTICCYGALLSASIFVGIVLWSIHSGMSVTEVLQYTPNPDDIMSLIKEFIEKVKN